MEIHGPSGRTNTIKIYSYSYLSCKLVYNTRYNNNMQPFWLNSYVIILTIIIYTKKLTNMTVLGWPAAAYAILLRIIITHDAHNMSEQ